MRRRCLQVLRTIENELDLSICAAIILEIPACSHEPANEDMTHRSQLGRPWTMTFTDVARGRHEANGLASTSTLSWIFSRASPRERLTASSSPLPFQVAESMIRSSKFECSTNGLKITSQTLSTVACPATRHFGCRTPRVYPVHDAYAPPSQQRLMISASALFQ